MNMLQPDWPAPKHIKAYTTLRQGWGGRKPYHADNRGYYLSDHQGYEQESQALGALLQLPTEPIWLNQTHGTTVLEALPENREKNADASFATHANQVCTVLTADCLPLLICHENGTHVAAIHAGWRGLAKGIIEATLAAMHLPAEEMLVWLGPAIGPQKFEVGEDVYQAFTQPHPEAASAFHPHREGKWLANLYTLATQRLNAQGVRRIYGGQFCTYTQEDLFFSYRRDGKETGRMASVIWIEK